MAEKVRISEYRGFELWETPMPEGWRVHPYPVQVTANGEHVNNFADADDAMKTIDGMDADTVAYHMRKPATSAPRGGTAAADVLVKADHLASLRPGTVDSVEGVVIDAAQVIRELRNDLAAARERERCTLEWAYALMVELAVVCLDETNRTTEPGDWPNGQEWSDLVGTSRSVFMHKARERAGIDHDEWRKVFEPEVDDRMVDIWERKAAQDTASE